MHYSKVISAVLIIDPINSVTYKSYLLSVPIEVYIRAFLDISAAVSADSVFPEPGVPCLDSL